MKHLALVWAEGSSEEMRKFDFVFHISLKTVTANSTLEDIIIRQHKALNARGVQPGEVKSILNGKQKVLLLIDGFDEYTKGTNESIDKAIEKDTLWDCSIILTSRVIPELEEVKQFMDAEAAIHGFSETKIKEYAAKFLGSEEDGEELVDKAKKSRIDSLLSIPVILQMISVLFTSTMSLPETRTGILQAIVRRCIDCSFVRLKEHKPNLQKSEIHKILIKLGGLAWKSLQSNVKQLLLNKVSNTCSNKYNLHRICLYISLLCRHQQ